MRTKGLFSIILILVGVLCSATAAMAGEPGKGAGGPVLAEDGRYHGLGLVQEPEGAPTRFIQIRPSGAKASRCRNRWTTPNGSRRLATKAPRTRASRSPLATTAEHMPR